MNAQQRHNNEMIRQLENGIAQAESYIADARYMYKNAKGTTRRAKIAAELMHYKQQQRTNEKWLEDFKAR